MKHLCNFHGFRNNANNSVRDTDRATRRTKRPLRFRVDVCAFISFSFFFFFFARDHHLFVGNIGIVMKMLCQRIHRNLPSNSTVRCDIPWQFWEQSFLNESFFFIYIWPIVRNYTKTYSSSFQVLRAILLYFSFSYFNSNNPINSTRIIAWINSVIPGNWSIQLFSRDTLKTMTKSDTQLSLISSANYLYKLRFIF